MAAPGVSRVAYFYSNPAAEQLLGYTQKEICELGRTGLLDTEDPNLQVMLNERKYSGRARGELVFIKKNGSKFPAEISTNIFKDENNHLNTFMIIRDISRRKKAEKALKESEAQYHTLFENNHAVMLLIEPDTGKIIDANNFATSFYGYNHEELINMKISDINLLELGDVINEMQKSKLLKKSNFLFKHRLANGKVRDVDVYSAPITVGGKTLLYSIIHDITERRKIEDALRKSRKREKYLADLLEHSDQPFVIEYPDGRLGLVNRAFEDLTGYTREELQKADWTETLIPEEYRGMEQERLKEIRCTDTPVRYEMEYLRKDGTKVPVELLAHHMKNDDGQINYYYAFITDISERKQSEYFIQNTLKRFYNILSGMRASILLVKENHLIEYLNQAFCDYFDLNETPSELIGITDKEMIEKIKHVYKNPEGEIVRINEITENWQSVIGEEISMADGRTCLRDFVPISIGDKFYGRLWLHLDIAERKIAEERKQEMLEKEQRLTRELQSANTELQSTTHELQLTNELLQDQKNVLEHFNIQLEESKADLQSILDLTPTVILIAHDPECRKITGNAYLNRIMKVSAGDNISNGTSKDDQSVDYQLFRDKLKLRPDEFPAKVAAKTGEPVEEAEYNLVFSNGRIVKLLLAAVPLFDIDGNVRGSIVAGMDITHHELIEQSLRESEERLRLAQIRGNVGVWDCNNITNEFNFTPELEQLYGVVPGTIKTYNDFRERIHPDDKLKVEAERDKKIANHESFDIEFRILHKSGIRWISSRGGAIYNDDGEVIRILGVNLDITERKLVEMELKESNKELEQFAYVSSHDLQEPLRMVALFTQLLERKYRDKLDKEANEYIDFIVDGSKRMKMLIDDLLTFSRLNTQTKEHETVDLKSVLKTVLLNLHASIDENNVKITNDPLPQIQGDESRMVQFFQNLISNAIKFNDKKTPKIHITVQREQNQWLFTVSDNGIGMDSKYLERIFTLFQRLHTRQEYDGTGIGLTIAQKIIQQHGGQIWVESELGKGTTFFFTLPRSKLTSN